jgi:hypothetical protein
MRLTRHATRDQLTKPNNEHLPDGIGGTITGGAMEPIGLTDILERGARGASRGGAVSGAAQVVADGLGRSSLAGRGIALSDGSRICFASIADVGLLHEDDVPMARGGQTPLPGDSKSSVPNDDKPRAMAGHGARAAGTHRVRVLASV